jgi:uncharacterized membrane protein YbhN (UPF0104 family)
MKQKLKVGFGFLILIITTLAFTRYVTTHPALVDKLTSTNPFLLATLLALYILWFFALVVILRISLRLFGKTMGRQENILLNAYSSLINFFGPGQSGPVFRGVYLKKRHGLPVKSYIYATVLYYGFYAVISAFFMFVGTRPWWQTALLVAAAGTVSAIVIRWYARRSSISGNVGMNIGTLGLLFAATAAQLLLQLAIFYLELHSVHPDVTLAQAIAYTGTANFAVFASITPGAIGIREALLALTSNLHGMSVATTVAANVIDRAIYFVLLGLLFVLTITLHAKDKLRPGLKP